MLTLMIITLFLLFIMTQFQLIINTTKQVTTMEKQINAELIAEMGIDYYREVVDSYIRENDITNAEDLEPPRPSSSDIPSLDSSNNYHYQITNITKPDITEFENRVEVAISFTSTGTANNKTESIEDVINITFKSE
ncbi:hypothetical protein VBD025_09410 [Virgibacillus flavescens]|uniref:hypothetical protein n=1 Tax=Virgibacillus flavescens TaxID=1611422 RepID=UPI003D3597B3